MADAANLNVDPTLHPDKRIFFLQGPPGAGKTTLAIRRLSQLLHSGVPAESILVWVPQRVLGRPYTEALWELDIPGSEVTVVTVGGLARRTLALYWPLIAEKAGFGLPDQEPIFLTLETTQYYMDRIVSPYIDQGHFDGISIRRNRLVSQIIDNLNKAAVVGFPHTDVAARLKQAWSGESARLRAYDQVQACVNGFRTYCLAHNLLDFSLQLDIFFDHFLTEPACRGHLFGRYRHLIVDNVEEDTPRAHDLLKQWLGECESALVVMDQGGGYRAFLGADAEGAAELKWSCQDWMTLDRSYVVSAHVQALGDHLVQSLGREVAERLSGPSPAPRQPETGNPRVAIHFELARFQHQMIEWVADQVALLVHERDVPPGEIAILSPFLGDALRFALSNALSHRQVPVRSHRPSRALREEPAARCLLTWAAFARPDWGLCPAPPDVTQALMLAVDGLDLIRARLLTEVAYRPREGRPMLTSFDQMRTDMQQRISFTLGERFERLRGWLAAYGEQRPLELDDLLDGLFTELLSQPGFGFYRNLDAGRVTANLIESYQKFRRVVGGTTPGPLGPEYLRTVDQGIIAATYVQSWQIEATDAVLMAPAYTFLMANRPVEVQFWLDVGSSAWWERLYQPLTHPHVLSRQWPEGKTWGDEEEFAARQIALGRLVLGLVRRCRTGIYLGISELGEQGYEQRGPLLQAIQRTLRRTPPPSQDL
ncbi:MAG: ATP-dependent helicase [Anaerolineae bacterium]|nr:ATP-dependent helicase [Anaerolineae bacterium]